jgi:ketosteroid isomerase-like protein
VQTPWSVPDADELARRLAAEALVLELFARIDARDIDGALELYADDAVFLDARGKEAIRAVMVRGTAPNADKRSRHVIGNVRASSVDADTTVVEYTAVAYTLEGPGPYGARSVFDQRHRHARQSDGTFLVADHQISGFTLP